MRKEILKFEQSFNSKISEPNPNISFDRLPFYSLSTKQGSTAPQSLGSSEAYGIDIDPDLQFVVSTSLFKSIFGYDVDGDGINDLVPPGDKVCIEQGDFYLLDAMASAILGISKVFAAYSFDGTSFEVAGDSNSDGYISPDEYLPQAPYLTGGEVSLAAAREYPVTAVDKADIGIGLTLAESEDYYELLPVNSDPDFRAYIDYLAIQ